MKQRVLGLSESRMFQAEDIANVRPACLMQIKKFQGLSGADPARVQANEDGAECRWGPEHVGSHTIFPL